MSQTMHTPSPTNTPALGAGSRSFVERRTHADTTRTPNIERRQFTNSYDDLSPDAAELARAVDQYKLVHRRRFVTFEEILAVVKSLGYQR